MKKMAKMMDRAAWNARKKMMALAAKAKEAIENEDGDTNFISIAIILVIVLIIAMIFILCVVTGIGIVIRKNNKKEAEEKSVVIQEETNEVNEHFKVYLAVGEKYVLDGTDYVSDDPGIASVNGNVVSGTGVRRLQAEA